MSEKLRRNALDIVLMLPKDHSEALAVLAYVPELIDWADGGVLSAAKPRSNVVRLVGDVDLPESA